MAEITIQSLSHVALVADTRLIAGETSDAGGYVKLSDIKAYFVAAGDFLPGDTDLSVYLRIDDHADPVVYRPARKLITWTGDGNAFFEAPDEYPLYVAMPAGFTGLFGIVSQNDNGKHWFVSNAWGSAIEDSNAIYGNSSTYAVSFEDERVGIPIALNTNGVVYRLQVLGYEEA